MKSCLVQLFIVIITITKLASTHLGVNHIMLKIIPPCFKIVY